MHDTLSQAPDPPQILIVDDTVANLKLLVDLIAPRGYQVRPATSGKLALRAVKAETPDLILLDIMMPEMDGYEVCRLLKGNPEYADIPIIFISGLGEVEDKIRGFEVGGVDYITKPFQGEEVMARVETHLTLRELQRDLADKNDRLKQEVEEREKTQARLKRLNDRLAVLYQVSRALNRSIEMDRLLADILRVLTDSKLLSFSLKGAVYLLEEGEMGLAAVSSLQEQDPKPCQVIHHETCLCGLALKSGEVVVSSDSREDPRHSLCCPGQGRHGHVIVPLKSFHETVGILLLYTEAGYQLEDESRTLLSNIGSLVGIAISNAKLYEETRLSSLHDALTGLANRRYLQIELEKGLKAAKYDSDPLSVVILDIDHFKKYNDTHGHLEGDKLLIELAGILQKIVRKNDQIFRYGGEEFLVLLWRTDLEKARNTAERLREAVSSETDVTISLGVASFEGDLTQGSLIDRADKAMYQAKTKGRNRVEVI